jgi:Mn2+/Fe2+ NRAMP family transporter
MAIHAEGNELAESVPRSAVRVFVRSFGPAWIVMIADVDAASILTAAENGVVFRYGLIWLLLVLIIPLFFVQEAAGRVGVVTRRGLGEVIRTTYSRRTAVLVGIPMTLTSFLSYVVQYTGIAIGMGLLGVPPLVSLPLAYAAHIGLVYKRKFATVEKGLLVVSVVFIASCAISLFLRGVVPDTPIYLSASPKFLYFVAADVGAVVMPFMLFYQASATAEKGTGTVWTSRLETLIGAIVSEVIMIVIVMVNVGVNGAAGLASPQALSTALSVVVGGYAPILFGIGLVAAAFLALVVIAFASAWGLVEAVGWGRKRYFPVFLAESAPAVLVPLLFGISVGFLLQLMVVFVFVLLGPGIVMGFLASDPKVMGVHASKGSWKWAYWLCLAAVLFAGVLALVTNL